MLSREGFNLWADDYDKSVGLSDEDNTYPFAGYKDILNAIYQRVLGASSRRVLDIGFGTGTLTVKLYEQGCLISGQDFSDRMIALAQEKMPHACLYQGDFAQGLVPALRQQRYDAIIATYSLHHLTDEQKVAFITNILDLLQEDGCLYIGDVAFDTRAGLEACRASCGTDWDEDEIYFVYDEMKTRFPQLTFEPMSHCAGLMTLRRSSI